MSDCIYNKKKNNRWQREWSNLQIKPSILAFFITMIIVHDNHLHFEEIWFLKKINNKIFVLGDKNWKTPRSNWIFPRTPTGHRQGLSSTAAAWPISAKNDPWISFWLTFVSLFVASNNKPLFFFLQLVASRAP